MPIAFTPDSAREKRRQVGATGWSRFRRLGFEPLEARRLLAVLTVNSLADNVVAGDGLVTLREAIHAANTNTITDLQQLGSGADVIRFDAALNGGTILLSSGELPITEALTIDAATLPGGLTINAQRQSRILDITADTGNFTITGLTLTGGRTTEANGAGGAIRALTSGDLILSQSTISGSRTEGEIAAGGGIFARGNVILSGSNITGNHTQGDHATGGGVYSLADVVLTSSTVSGNFTQGPDARGGGLYARRSVTLNHSHVRVNHTAGTFSAGAGIAAGDQDGGFGGVIIFNSTVSGNFTIGNSGHGAGIAAWGPVTILHSDVIYNITFNTAATGGGIWSRSDSIVITNSIVALNAAAASPDIRPGGTLDVAFSLIGNNGGTLLTAAPVGSPDANGNLVGSVASPINPLLGPHANNGGTTLTHALIPGSPAIDAGNPNTLAGVGGVPNFDQRGTGFARVSGGRLDMGSFEVQVPPIPPIPRPLPADPFGGSLTIEREAPLNSSPLVPRPVSTLPPLLFVAERLRFRESDGGSGGGMPLEEDNFGPRADSDAERALRELLSSARIATREEVVDAVYALGDIERVSLVGFDMGDEPLAARKKQEKVREPAAKRDEIVVNKPPTDPVATDDTSWTIAIWSALAGGGTLWMGGTWWWLGRTRRRSALT